MYYLTRHPISPNTTFLDPFYKHWMPPWSSTHWFWLDRIERWSSHIYDQSPSPISTHKFSSRNILPGGPCIIFQYRRTTRISLVANFIFRWNSVQQPKSRNYSRKIWKNSLIIDVPNFIFIIIVIINFAAILINFRYSM